MYWANIGVAWGSGEVSAYLINGSTHMPNSIKKFSVRFLGYFLVVVTEPVRLLGHWSTK